MVLKCWSIRYRFKEKSSENPRYLSWSCCFAQSTPALTEFLVKLMCHIYEHKNLDYVIFSISTNSIALHMQTTCWWNPMKLSLGPLCIFWYSGDYMQPAFLFTLRKLQMTSSLHLITSTQGICWGENGRCTSEFEWLSKVKWDLEIIINHKQIMHTGEILLGV